MILFASTTSAQISFKPILTGEFMYDYYRNPISYLYYDMIILQNPTRQDGFDTLKTKFIQDFLEKPYSIKYYLDDLRNVALIRRKDKIKFFRILKRNSNYMLLCKENKSLCDCKASMAIYFFDTDLLKNVERPFSFSLKRNLVYRLCEQGIEVDTVLAKKELCSLLQNL